MHGLGRINFRSSAKASTPEPATSPRISLTQDVRFWPQVGQSTLDCAHPCSRVGSGLDYLRRNPIAVTDEEASSVFDELMRALREKDLHWIADQVSREIAEGRPVVAILTPEQAPKLGPFSVGRPRKTRARAAEFTRVLPYDAKSKLLKLIASIETTVASSAAIIEHLAEFVSAGQPFDIIFRSDEADKSDYRISDDDLAVTVPAGERLQHLLSELKNEVNGAS
jgi:hypothetical protein